MVEDLKAGFTGSRNEQPEGLRGAARTAGEAVRRETNAIVVGAADHPHTATSVVLGIGLLAFAMGYLVGRTSTASDYRDWR